MLPSQMSNILQLALTGKDEFFQQTKSGFSPGGVCRARNNVYSLISPATDVFRFSSGGAPTPNPKIISSKK